MLLRLVASGAFCFWGYGLKPLHHTLLRCERKAGELLKEKGFGEHGGDRKSTRKMRVELADFGLDWNQSFRWRLEANCLGGAATEDRFHHFHFSDGRERRNLSPRVLAVEPSEANRQKSRREMANWCRNL